MIRSFIANLSARMLRASVARIATDLELVQSIQAARTSTPLIAQLMGDATVCRSRERVMDVALATVLSASVGEGFFCELGVYKGESLNRMAKLVAPAKVHGFDTFTGLPEAWRSGYPQGTFDVSSLDLRFEPNCVLHKGLFANTLPNFLRNVDGQAKLIHIDCDLYNSTRQALTLLQPRIKRGTVIVFDEYFNYPGWEGHEYKAFSEFLNQTGLGCRYLAYNSRAQQVAVVIT